MMGSYPYDKNETTEPVLWRVLSVEDNQALLLTEYVIDTSQVIFETDKKAIEKRTYRRIKTFAESDLYPEVDTKYYDRIFLNEPLSAEIVNDPAHGRLFIPDRDFYLQPGYGFPKAAYGTNFPTRKAKGTEYACKVRGLYRDSNGMSPYWVSTLKNGDKDYKVQLVGYDGHLSYGALTRVNVGLRFAVKLKLDSIQIVSGDGTIKDPYVLEYTGKVKTGNSAVNAAVADREESMHETAEETTGTEIMENNAHYSGPVDVGDDSGEAADSVPDAHPDSDSDNEEVLISYIGDCSIGDAINSTNAASSYHSVVRREGYGWPFSLVHKYLAEDDLTIANLEVVITEKTKHKDIMYPLRASPSHVNILLEGSVEVVNTVNNHSYDYFRQGYEDTLAALDESGIGRFGSVYYMRKDGFDDLLVRDVKGIRFGFVGISYPQKEDISGLTERINKLKEEEGCDIVTVSLHWGRETYMQQNGTQMSIAKNLIDSGADIIYGHHPHVLQPLLFYKGKPVMFSTGNFTFGTMSNVDKHTGIFQFHFHKTENGTLLSRIQVIPCMTSGKNDYRPYEITDTDQRRKTFQILSPKKTIRDFEKPPESFLDSGMILFDEKGKMVTE